MIKYGRWGTGLHDLSLMHDDDLITDLGCDAQIMCNKNHGEIHTLLDVLQQA